MKTAQKVYKEILEMPIKEREKLFAVIARRGFEKDYYNHEEVFDDIRQSPFTIKEASDYLEVAEITVRRWVKSGKIKARRVGKSIVFNADDLKKLKKRVNFRNNRLLV
ncbi:periplasmic molybdate-binding protein [Candidatus Scalindua japonica]|uniref:Periplasmic molybdate-binding protein n=1 Tax=Candidatus Scalindua japonica TaxID=1284222 RepID=A0A286TTD4_9BACT|nr:helix-turn-helix domain-containing protein [Candidatus Scalindua japonica]GAX59152.1 periplasmic molybdate-binding protein [Candidatus Scalindua japonica]